MKQDVALERPTSVETVNGHNKRKLSLDSARSAFSGEFDTDNDGFGYAS